MAREKLMAGVGLNLTREVEIRLSQWSEWLSKELPKIFSEKWSWGLAFLSFIVVGFLKIQQFRHLQNQAYDLGIYVNVLWNTAHGRFFYLAVRGGENYLGDHFSPILFVLSPIMRFWPSGLPLLILQSFALAMAIPAVHRLAARASGAPSVGFGFALWFAVFPFVHKVSRFDFHEVALAVPLFFWLLESWEAEATRRTIVLAALLVLVREDCVLFLAAAALWAAWLGAPRRHLTRRRLLVSGLITAVGFVGVFYFLMPFLSSNISPAEINYGHWGGSQGVAKALTQPGVLWAETLGHPGKRASLLALVGWTGGLFLLAPGRAFLAALPILVNLVGVLPVQWRFDLHYSALILPFLFWAMAEGWARGQWCLKKAQVPDRWRVLSGALFFMTVVGFSLTRGKEYYVPISQEKREALVDLLALVAPGDSVQATTNLVPLLACRKVIRMVPSGMPTRWVVLDFSPTGLMIPPEEQKMYLNFNQRFRYSVVFSRENLRLYDLARTTGEGI